jgi:hypothetical protein
MRLEMSFLDNLENNLKALERQEERDPEKIKRDQERRESERDAAIRRAPFIEALKTSAFTSELLTQCRTIGREARVLVRFTWLGDTLRLDAGAQRLDLVPEPEGIAAVFSKDGSETDRKRLNLAKDDPEKLVRAWLLAP